MRAAICAPALPHARVRDQASRMQNKVLPAAKPAIPAHLKNFNLRPPSSAQSAPSLRERRAPRDEREAKKMELERFHLLLLSLDMSLDKTPSSTVGSGGKRTERKEPLKGVFASSQEYVNTFGPLVMEEVRAAHEHERVACASACVIC